MESGVNVEVTHPVLCNKSMTKSALHGGPSFCKTEQVVGF